MKKESKQFGLAVRLNLHALVTRATLESGWDSREEFVCARGRDSKRIANSLVLILCETVLPICVLLGAGQEAALMVWQPSGSLMAVFTAVFMGTMSSMESF